MKIILTCKCNDLGRMEFCSRFTPPGLGSIAARCAAKGSTRHSRT